MTTIKQSRAAVYLSNVTR